MKRAQSLRRSSLLVAALATSASIAASTPETTIVEDADLCAVLANPIAYDRKLLRLAGSIARDFETFWIESPSCPDAFPIWIEYGGPEPADGLQWHKAPEQPSADAPLVVSGLTTTLIADSKFRKFDSMTKSLKRGKRARATVVGWIFAAGTYTDDAGAEQEIGFGPYAMYSLLVIRHVDTVSRR